MYYFALLALVASVSANFGNEVQCPKVTPVENFDFAAYGQGVWYEVARYNHELEKNGQCGFAKYELLGDVIKVRNVHVDHNRVKYIEGSARLAHDAGTTGKVIHSLPYGARGAITDNVLNILAIKYDRYLIGYHCEVDEDRRGYREYAWVLSRCKSLSEQDRAAVERYVNDCNVLKSSKFLWPSFSDEDCRVDG